MATVSRHSLTEELDTLKARFEALCAEGTMSPQTRALFEALLALFAVWMAVFMEKTTPKGSADSSLPSSRTGDDATALARPGAKAKGPAHNAGHCANTRTREHVGQRGRVAKSDAHNLHERLHKHETAVLLFAANPHVPFTNNRAELHPIGTPSSSTPSPAPARPRTRCWR